MKRKRHLQVLIFILIALLILMTAGCAKKETAPTPVISGTPVALQTATPTPVPSVEADFSVLGENIMLIGVDYAPERDTWGGKHMYHADIMMVLHIDSETKKVSIISLPKDTYSKIPGVEGIYKLNASLNCGGDWPTQSACEKVCEAASWVIGGIPINYYYAVDITAAKDLVDEIKGVDYDLDASFSVNGRSYSKGLQHMDGQAVLDYIRVRNSNIENDGSSAGDQTQRQQRMMLAIFQNLKDSGKMSQVPAIINDFTSNNLVTNTSLAQTMALAAYMSGINSDDIVFKTMDGRTIYLGNLRYLVIEAESRRQIIQDVYGIDITDQDAVQRLGISVPSYTEYSEAYIAQLWEQMEIYVVAQQSRRVLDDIKTKLYADANSKYLADGEEWTLYNRCESEYEQLVNWDTMVTSSADFTAYNDFVSGFKDNIESLSGMFSIIIDNHFWDVIYNPYYGACNQPYVQNQIAVDPR